MAALIGAEPRLRQRRRARALRDAHVLRRVSRQRGSGRPVSRARARHHAARDAGARAGPAPRGADLLPRRPDRSARRGSALPRAAAAREIAVVGLGVGTLATYARPDQRWTFFEIDPGDRADRADARVLLVHGGVRRSLPRGHRRRARVARPRARARLRSAGARRVQLRLDPDPSDDARGGRAVPVAPGARTACS